jgi:hypothetical protein
MAYPCASPAYGHVPAEHMYVCRRGTCTCAVEAHKLPLLISIKYKKMKQCSLGMKYQIFIIVSLFFFDVCRKHISLHTAFCKRTDYA